MVLFSYDRVHMRTALLCVDLPDTLYMNLIYSFGTQEGFLDIDVYHHTSFAEWVWNLNRLVLTSSLSSEYIKHTFRKAKIYSWLHSSVYRSERQCFFSSVLSWRIEQNRCLRNRLAILVPSWTWIVLLSTKFIPVPLSLTQENAVDLRSLVRVSEHLGQR